MTGCRETFIGPWGQLLPVQLPAPIQTSLARPSGSVTLLSGQQVVQRAPRSYRSWRFDLLAFPEGLKNLEALEVGVFGPGPFFWLDERVSPSNLLPPEDSFARRDLAVGDIVLGDGGVLPDGRRIPVSLDLDVGYGLSTVFPLLSAVPVIPGDAYAVRVFAVTDPVAVELDWIGDDKTSLGVPTVASGPSVSGVAPSQAAGVQVRVEGGEVLAVDLRAGDVVPDDWTLGQGVPRVVINGSEGLWRLLDQDPDRTVRNFVVTLEEVAP